jgi:hypothetical protein
MESLSVVMGYEFANESPKESLAEYHELIETLGSDALHESFRMRIAIWTAGRDTDAVDTAGFEQCGPRGGEKRIAIVNEVGGTTQETIGRVDPDCGRSAASS